jgi:hypothetical protein
MFQDYWMADPKSGFANPFARMGSIRPLGGSAFAELMSKTSDAMSKMGKGIPVKTFTRTTSTNDKGEQTTSAATMEVADSSPSMREAAKKTAEQAAKDAAAQTVKKGLGGLFRRP